MRYTRFRSLSLSRLTYGSMSFAGIYNKDADISKFEESLVLALKQGVNVVHTSYYYGDGQVIELLGKLFKEHAVDPKPYVICKVGVNSDGIDIKSIEKSLYYLGVTSIDFLQLAENSYDPECMSLSAIIQDLAQSGPVYNQVLKLKQDRKFKFLGVELYDHIQARTALEIPSLDFVVCDQSLVRRVIYEPDTVASYLEKDIGVFAIRPLAGGWLTDRYRTIADFEACDKRKEWYHLGQGYRAILGAAFEEKKLDLHELALCYLNSTNYITSAVVGMRTPEQVVSNLGVFKCSLLGQRTMKWLESLIPQPTILEED